MEGDSHKEVPASPTGHQNEQSEESDENTSTNCFNSSNIDNTVIEKADPPTIVEQVEIKIASCEGSDSGVEVIEHPEGTLERAISSNSQDYETANSNNQSCNSSIISCFSNYDEAFSVLVRRNSTLIDDYKLLKAGDGTSENGSESSSVASTKISRRSILSNTKKKVILDSKKLSPTKDVVSRSRSKPPITPRTSLAQTRNKSVDRNTPKTSKLTPKVRTKPVPDSLTTVPKKEVKRTLLTRSISVRTPTSTPTDDGRWPSSKSNNSSVMTRSLRGSILAESTKTRLAENKNTLEKYATLPRRRKERSADDITELQKSTAKSRETSATRVTSIKRQLSKDSTPVSKTLPLYPKKKVVQKTRIYHETGAQTALDLKDIEKALAGIHFIPVNPQDVEKATKEIQVDRRHEELQKLQDQFSSLLEKYEKLKGDFNQQSSQLKATEQKLREETLEKEGLIKELKNNNERVFAMLGCDESGNVDDSNTSSDSLLVLETRFQNVSQVIIKQEEEISKLNVYCRALQRDFDKSLEHQQILFQQQQDMEAENKELHEFMQMEKTTLSDALKESESEIKRQKMTVAQKDKELENKVEECRHVSRISDQRRQDNMSLQARYVTLEAKCRELLVHQGSTVSGAAVALSALISRLEGLVDELVNSYNISEQELEDVIFHNEAYSNSSSSPDATPDKCRKFIIDKSPSPKRGSSFVSAVINAIRNATAQSPFINRENSKDNITDNSDSTELLDSETEPCLMMEHVLEDVIVPDGHSHNMISSCHSMMSSIRLSHSESLNSLSQSSRQKSDRSSNLASLSELCPSVSLVDQVIDVDNLVTRLLKVIRIIQIENEDYINDLQDERDSFCGQVNTQRDTNKIVVKQLKDWELLGAKWKGDLKELNLQLGRKNSEIEDIKNELNQQRKEVEKLNQDVCDLSTALSKSELENKIKEEEVAESLKKWESSGEVPSSDVLGRLIVIQNEVPTLREKLEVKEKQLNELTQEYVANRQVLSESLKSAVKEAKKQYEALDYAIETLNNIQSVVQQCPQLLKLQCDLEEISFQSASAMPLAIPPDYNANAALLQALANLEVAPPINTTA